MAARTREPGATRFLPDDRDLASLADAAVACRGCELHERATRTVFGRGPATARLMLVGEQPGDVEDTEGEAFVGPAGKLLDRALDDAGLSDADIYLTNAVKHFRWKAVRGSKRRIHDKPTAGQATACRPWLAAELAALRPPVLVALGAVAAGSLFGTRFRLSHHRGSVLDWPPQSGPFADDASGVGQALATIHPSAVLRAPDDGRDEMYHGLVDDLRLAGSLLR